MYLYLYLYLYLDLYFYLYWTPLCNKSWRETSIKSLPILPFCPSALSENPWRSTVKGNPVWQSSPKSILISCFQPTLLRSRQSTKLKVLLGFFVFKSGFVVIKTERKSCLAAAQSPFLFLVFYQARRVQSSKSN